MTRQAALNGCTESEPVCVHFSKVNKLPYNTTTLIVSWNLISVCHVNLFQCNSKCQPRVSSSARVEIRPSLQTDVQNLSLHLLSVLSSTRDNTCLWEEMSALYRWTEFYISSSKADVRCQGRFLSLVEGRLVLHSSWQISPFARDDGVDKDPQHNSLFVV